MAVARKFLDVIPGVTIEEVGVSPERPMLLARLDGSGPGRMLTFAGHMDTVPAGDGWTVDAFGGTIRDGRLYGRGTSDMKGGIAGFMVAIGQLAELRDQWRGTVVAHIVPDEEPGGQLGTQVLLEKGLLTGDAVVVAEPSELCVYRAQKGNIFAQIRFSGRSAHGSTPQLGHSAIVQAARAALWLEETLGPALASSRHELVGCASVNVGTISGGRRTNMVPDDCILTVDRRVLPGEQLEHAFAELEQAAGPEGVVSYDHVGAAFETPAEHWLVRDAVAVVDAVRGHSCPVGGLVGSSDARFYAASADLPTIIVGPGAMSEAHTPDESVDVELLELSVDVYRELALRILRTDP